MQYNILIKFNNRFRRAKHQTFLFEPMRVIPT